jgi:7-cyano-7-deazaguanine synthase
MDKKNREPAVLLLSGGLDSCTTLAVMLEQGFEPFCLSFSYGQRHDIELTCAKKIAAHYGVSHKIIDIDLKTFGQSSLTSDEVVPEGRHEAEIKKAIPNTYVPARNTIFLSYALALAETSGAFDIFIGANIIDYSGYPDCRPEYIEAFAKMANLALAKTITEKRQLQIHTPLIKLTKEEIISKGVELGVDYGLTNSCYNPKGEKSCGKCDACYFRLDGFEKAGITDPIPYL